MKRVALATCSAHPDLDPDGENLICALSKCGLAATPAIWNDPIENWSDYEAVVLRSTWDYSIDFLTFVRWLYEVNRKTRLLNPLDPVLWSLKKTYIHNLEDWGLPVVPTKFAHPDQAYSLPAYGEFVVKPCIASGARHAVRYGPNDTSAACAHVEQILSWGVAAMMQPYLSAVENQGETGLVFLGGSYSHAFKKGAILTERNIKSEQLYAAEEISHYEPSADELEIARLVAGAIKTRFGILPYFRVDLLPSCDGPLLLELELAEPSLYLSLKPDSEKTFAMAIRQALDSE